MKIIHVCLTSVLFCSSLVANAAEHKIMQKDRAFSVNELNINSGDKIVFVNDDDVMHNVYSKSAENKFEIKKQNPGESVPITFSTPGVVKAKCAIHPQMILTINVK